MFEGGYPVKVQSYQIAAKSWSDLRKMKRFNTRVSIEQSTGHYRIEFFDVDLNTFVNVRIGDTPYNNTAGDVRYQFHQSFNPSDVAFQIRKVGKEDELNASPMIICAEHNGTIVSLFFDDNFDVEGYAEAYMKETPNDSFIQDNRAWWYFSEEIDVGDGEDAVYDRLNNDDTYYLFNQHYDEPMFPFKESDKHGVSNRWGEDCRFNVALQTKPWFKLYNNSPHAIKQQEDLGRANTYGTSYDYLMRTDRGDQLSLKIVPQNSNWAMLRNEHNKRNIGICKDNPPYLNTNKDDENDKTAWQIVGHSLVIESRN
eukprot:Selendium_serpulae@DN6431_c1_g1_i1.p1